MRIHKNEVLEALQHIAVHGSNQNIVEAGHVQNIQIFGDEVEIDVLSKSAALAVKKKLEVDVLKVIHEKVYAKAKIKVNIRVAEPETPPNAQLKGPELPGVKNIIAIASGKTVWVNRP